LSPEGNYLRLRARESLEIYPKQKKGTFCRPPLYHSKDPRRTGISAPVVLSPEKQRFVYLDDLASPMLIMTTQKVPIFD
jgi:hypothetical protein